MRTKHCTSDEAKKEAAKCVAEIDLNGDGKVDFEEFTAWYTRSEQLIRNQLEKAIDGDESSAHGVVSRSTRPGLLALLVVDEAEVETAATECLAAVRFPDEPDAPVDRRAFMDWFVASDHFHARREANAAGENSDEGALHLRWPDETRERVLFVVTAPLIFVLYHTLPDVRRTRFENWYLAAFFGSIVWIGVFSYLMVWWITITGNTFGIPAEVMGLTFLAASTSIPDLLSSVIVARKGHGAGRVLLHRLQHLRRAGGPAAALAGQGHRRGRPGQRRLRHRARGHAVRVALHPRHDDRRVILIIKLSNWRMTKALGPPCFCALFVCGAGPPAEPCLSESTADWLGSDPCTE